MTNVYYCVTGNWLHSSKKLFSTMSEVKHHIDYILSMKPDWIDDYEVISSIRVTMIDVDEVPRYKEIFTTREDIVAPRPRLGYKCYKRPFICPTNDLPEKEDIAAKA